jgi:hypothetical protein
LNPAQLSKHGWQEHEWHLLADDKGVPVGKWKVPFQPMAAEVEIVRQFLIKISQQKESNTATTTEKVNMVWLAGVLKFDPKHDDRAARCLIDVGQKSAIQIGVHKDDGGKELADKLLRFRQGDAIKVVCILEPWGVKQADNSWKNGLSVRITEIKTEPPKRAANTNSREKTDDDIPF